MTVNVSPFEKECSFWRQRGCCEQEEKKILKRGRGGCTREKRWFCFWIEKKKGADEDAGKKGREETRRERERRQTG